MENNIQTLKVTDLSQLVGQFTDLMGTNGQCDLCNRETSFDLCYNYFRVNRNQLTDDMEKSCCVLWSYLASWGMLRGSSFLFQKNPLYLAELIIYIQNECQDVFKIDIDKYTDANITRICNVYDRIFIILGGGKYKPSSTLITKIMLGVFGCVPAFDTFFCETFNKRAPNCGFKSKKVDKITLKIIFNFYKKNQAEIGQFANKIAVKDIFSKHKSYKQQASHYYTIAKIIDMYGFIYSFSPKTSKKTSKRKKRK